MNHALVVDASLAVKWVVKEEYSAEADALLRESAASDQAIMGPPHLLAEVANAVYQRVRTTDPDKHLTIDEAGAALAQFNTIGIQLSSPPELGPGVARFALMHQLPVVYDALYVVLAQLIDAELWTSDRKLIGLIGRAAPWVRYIGDYPVR